MSHDDPNPFRILASIALLGALGVAQGSSFMELEPNNSKGMANLVSLSPLFFISGTTSTTDPDYFRIRPLPPPNTEMHRYQLAFIGGTPGAVTASIRGLANPGTCPAPTNTDVMLQTTSLTTPILAWYGTGVAEVYVSIQGTGVAFVPYQAKVTREPVVPIHLGNFPNQTLTVTASIAGGTAEAYLCDQSYTPIDNAVQGSLLKSMSLGGGVGSYRLAVGHANLANSMCNPSTGDLTDFTQVFVANAQSNTVTTLNLAIQHAGGTKRPYLVFLSNNHPLAVEFFEFGVGTEITADLSRPGGPGTALILTNEGPPNTGYLNVFTLNQGAFPDGHFFGIDVLYPELFTQVLAGYPFIGNTGPTGMSMFNAGVIPPNLEIYFTVRRLDLGPHAKTPLWLEGG